MNALKVKDVMTHLVVTVRPEDTIPDAARRLLVNGISGAPVVEAGRLVGVVSEADLVRAFAPPRRRKAPPAVAYALHLPLRGGTREDQHDVRVGGVMTENVVSIDPDASIWEAASRIDRYGIRRLPVIDSARYVVGVLTRSDLVRCMARTDDDVARDVRRCIAALGEENFPSLEVEVDGGFLSVRGVADRKTTKEIAVRIAAQVPGVLEVSDELEWQLDDVMVKPAETPTNKNRIRREAWIVEPRVKATR